MELKTLTPEQLLRKKTEKIKSNSIHELPKQEGSTEREDTPPPKIKKFERKGPKDK